MNQEIPVRLLRKPVSRHGRVTAVSMMKDEGPFLLEWVAHHLVVGFTDLVVFTNDCTDGTDKMLMRLEELGLAHHRRNEIPPGRKPQPSALKHAEADPVVRNSDWVMVFDADEFLCIRHGDGTLDELLDAVVAAGGTGMVATWRIFGSGGIVEWSREPVTEQYVMAAPPLWNKGWGVKTLFRHDAASWKLGIHRPKMRNKVLETGFPDTVRWLNGSGRVMEDYFKFRGWRSILRTVGHDWVQMNHYAVKSVDSYAIRRLRGNVNNKTEKYGAAYWALQDRNETRDETVLRFASERRRISIGLLSDPVLGALHRAAVEQTEARLAELKATDAYGDFVAELAAASRVPIDAVEARPPKPRNPQAIAAKMSKAERRAVGDQRPPPVELYLQGPVEAAGEARGEWHSNQGVKLPADPRIFTPVALSQIAEGKFERKLARQLPALLPQGGRYLEVGAASGFLAARLARGRPDVALAIQEADPTRRAFIAGLFERNGLPPPELRDDTPGDPSRLAQDLAARPVAVLALGDPALGPDVFAALDAGLAATVLVVGRLWTRARQDCPCWEAAALQAGYAGRVRVDPACCAGFAAGGR